MMAKIVKFIKK